MRRANVSCGVSGFALGVAEISLRDQLVRDALELVPDLSATRLAAAPELTPAVPVVLNPAALPQPAAAATPAPAPSAPTAVAAGVPEAKPKRYMLYRGKKIEIND